MSHHRDGRLGLAGRLALARAIEDAMPLLLAGLRQGRPLGRAEPNVRRD
jgi:hypothetical protein